MPPSKRKPRRSRAADLQLDTSDVEMQDSSPSRPSAKKRKGNSGRAMKKEKLPTPELEPQPGDDSDDDTEDVSQQDLVDKVIANLTVSREPVVVARDHANEGADEHKVSAFAKLAGRDWTYYVRDMTINIGRPPDDRQALTVVPGASSPAQDLRETFPVHIDLGPSKIVSRHHASIFYDADWPTEDGGWHVRVNGRNGVRVNNTLLRRGNRQQIKSGAILEVAGTQMMFVTPGDKVEVDPYFVDRAEAAENGGDGEPNATASETEQKPAGMIGTGVSLYQSLAPAPPHFQRTSTPPPQDNRGQQSVFDSKPGTSPLYGRGMMMESTHEIDYSRDTAKDLKPPYSYAHMIAQAIFSSDDQKLTLSNIYSFIAEKYAFYRHSNSGWQNSIRHNLSLNKAFQKVPRRTDEPGKGMKWQIAPEFREEYWKKQQRRVGTSSNPSSPASKTDINPNFRGANGQNLGYDTSMVYQFSAKDATNPAAAPPKLNMSFPPYPLQPQPYPAGPSAASSQPPLPTSTPQRRRADTGNTMPDGNLDDSPTAPGPPQHFPSSAPRPSQGTNQPFYTLPASGPPPHHSPTNPTLSSSYLDTPFHPSQASSLLTPAPPRQNPRLAPPSTLVAPSKFMPESSPAGPGLFWKGFLGGYTPGPQSAIPPDMSPEKLDADTRPGRRNGVDDRDIMSSSPPPIDGDGPGMGSPTKGKVGRGRGGTMTTVLRSPLHDTASGKANGIVATSTATGASTSRASSSDTRPASSASAAAPNNNNTTTMIGSNMINTLSSALQLQPTTGPSRLSLGPSEGAGVFNLRPTPSITSSASPDKTKRTGGGDDSDDGDAETGGFDLARGFAPIGAGAGAGVGTGGNKTKGMGLGRGNSLRS